MVEVSIKVEGVDQLRRTLRALPDNLRRGALGNMLRKGGRLIVAQAKNNAPVETGALRDAIAMKTIPKSKTLFDAMVRIGVLSDMGATGLSAGVARKSTSGKKVRSTGLVGFANSDVYYWRFQEFGTSRDPSGHPFLVPAFEERKYQANKTMLDDLRKQVDKAAKKLAAQNIAPGGKR